MGCRALLARDTNNNNKQTIVPCTHVVFVAVVIFSQWLSVVFFGSFLQVKNFDAVDNSVGLFPFFMALHSNNRESGLDA